MTVNDAIALAISNLDQEYRAYRRLAYESPSDSYKAGMSEGYFIARKTVLEDLKRIREATDNEQS